MLHFENTRIRLALALFTFGTLATAQTLTIAPSNNPAVTTGGTLQFTATGNGFTIANIKWLVASVQGGSANTGTITTGLTGGLFTAPTVLPGQNPVTIGAVASDSNGIKYAASVYVLVAQPPPVITSVNPATLAMGTINVTVFGSGLLPGASVFVSYGNNSQIGMSTTGASAGSVSATGYLGSAASASFCVRNPGTACSNSVSVPAGGTAPATYTLTVVNGAGSGSYTAGAVVNITANAAPAGQQFQSWTGAAVGNASSASTTLTMPAANTIATATYAAIPPATYTLTVVNGAGSGSYAAGAVVNITANAPPAGQQFQSWTGAAVANSSVAATTLTMPAANTITTATYAAIPPATYTLTVVNGAGSGSYAAGAVVNITANAPPAGQQFQSWTGAAVANSSVAVTTLTMPAANTIATANYSAIPPATYTLTVVNGAGSGSYAAGTTVNITANAAPATQQFQSWTGAAVANSSIAATTLTMPAANTTVTATYAAVTSGPNIGFVSPNPLPSGTTTVTITGSGFSSSSIIWASGVQYPTLQPAANTLTTSIYIAPGTPSVTFTVHSAGPLSNSVTVPIAGAPAPTTYRLTVVNGAGSASYAAGTAVSIAANAAPPGELFASWTGPAVSNPSAAATTIVMPAANTTVTANFAAIPTYALTVVNGSNSGFYAAGTVVMITANTPPPGLVFSSWSGAAVASASSSTTTLVMPAANATVTANDSAPLSGPYTVTYSGLGSTAGFGPSDPNLYFTSQAVLVPGNTGYLFNPGHSFTGWNTAADGSGTAYGPGATFTIGNSNVTLYPQWNTQDWPVSVWGGAREAIVLKADGSVWTWGMNTYGQLGNGMTTDNPVPVEVLNPNGSGYLSGVTAVMGGEEHNLALKSDGTVWAWGMNLVNQLGNGNATASSTPVQVTGLSSIVSLGSRAYHSLAVKSDGTVWAWGEDRSGALGNGVADATPDHLVPIQVPGLSNPLMVTAGYYFSVALMSDHTLMAWGSNTNGQLGNGTTNPSYVPAPVQGIDNVIWVSAGWQQVVAIKSDGTVWTWGSNYWGGIYSGAGLLGDGTTSDHYLPEQVPGLAGAIQASGGDSFTAVLLRDGTVWTFGSNGAGQLGTGSFNSAQSLVPVQVQGLSNIVSITARDHHAQAIRSDGTVWSWGSGQNGELGNGTSQNSPTAVQVTWPGGGGGN